MYTFEELPGKTIFVGMNYYSKNRRLTGRRLVYGTIISASVMGIKIKAPDGKITAVPPDLRAIHPARKGKYGVLPNGEEITDPDLMSVWDLMI